MCGFVGWINNKEKIDNKRELFINMTETLSYRGPDSTGYYFKDNAMFGHKRLAIIDPEKGLQPMWYKNYMIIYNGELYNTDDIRQRLIEEGYTFDTTCDTEVLLKGYVHFKEKILDLIEGIYAFAIYDGIKLFMARDRLGVKPLFYSKNNNNFIFASEMKAILKSKIIRPIINKESLQELLALGPSRMPGSGVFKNILELRPAHYLIFDGNKIKVKRYWNVKEDDFKDNFEECKIKVKEMVESAIKRQMVSDVGISTFLSGGLDSSIISGVCSRKLAEENKTLATYSIDYEDNNKYFVVNDFQVSDDNYFISLMEKQFKTEHSYEVISQVELAEALKEAVLARDLPGMADVDASLYWFSKKIKEKNKVILSGECADEIFGGYPWFYKKELLDKKGFPWMNNLKERWQLLNPKLQKKINLEKFAYRQYRKTLSEVPRSKNKKEQKYKNLFYLNMTWFMVTLLERKDRMTMRASLEARVPFADHKLIEYLWNVPWKYKFYENMEKGLLREAFKDLLPKEIVSRKKNPYPKTHNPLYAELVSNLLEECLKNETSILYRIFDISKIKELIATKGAYYQKPWFGQLMTGPQLIAYLYQFDYWANEYNIIFDLS